MIIDFHTHYIPKEVINRGSVKLPSFMTKKVGEKGYNIEKRLEDMDASGIDIGILSNPLAPETDLESCKLNNDLMAQAVRKYPDRLMGLAHIPITENGKILEEFDRAIKDLGLKGLGISSYAGNIMLDSKIMWPIYQKASNLDVPILIHPRPLKPLGYEHMKEYDLVLSLGHEFDLTLCVFRLINGRVLENFPKLKMVISHFGGATPILIGRVRLFQDREMWGENGGEDESFVSLKSFDEFFNRIFFDMGGFGGWMNAVTCALTSIRTDRILFGTDYPIEIREGQHLKCYIENIYKLNIEDKEKQGILGGNARKLLG